MKTQVELNKIMEKRLLDTVLKEINSFGTFQLMYLTIILFPIILSQGLAASYAFTTSDLNYRCYIHECDTATSGYYENWVKNVIPFEKDKPVQCFRYVSNITEKAFECSATYNFDRSRRIECDRFVYETNERTIVNEFNMTCDGNKWLLALPGTLHSVGYFINLWFTGYISDTYGRKQLFICSSLIAATMGIMKSFSWNYISFLLFEFIDPLLSSGIYVSSFVLAMEILVPEHRGIAGASIFAAGAFGKVVLGISAMLLQNWRNLLRVNVSFTYLIIIAFWIFPESVRWLISKNRHQEAAKVLLKIAKINRVKIEPDLKDLLTNRPQDIIAYPETQDSKGEEIQNGSYKLKHLFKYPKMIQRVAICAFCWITNTFVFYGLSLISITIGGNKFVNFIVVQVIEVPAYIFVALFSHKIGRKKLESGGFLISAVILFIYSFFKSISWLKMTLFLLGKFAISIAFSTMYVYTSELFPTSLRHTLVAFCSAVGRVGSVLAPQTPYLETLIDNLSIYLFCGMGVIAGLLCILLPDTLNKKLPNTIQEALNLGKNESNEKI